MTLRVALNGFGRIGRNIFRVLYDRDDIVVSAICDVAEPANLAYLLKYDTVAGRFDAPVDLVNGQLCARGRLIPFVEGRAPGDARWRDYDVDVVIEASGRYRTTESLEKHLEAGARRVVLTVPPKDGMAVVVPKVNCGDIDAKTKIISAGSLALNALAPTLQAIDRAFPISEAFYTLVHAYTNEQTLGDVYKPVDLSVDDVPKDDLRRSRSAPENIIPATTHSPVQLDRVLPHLDKKVGGMALSAAVPDGSVVDLVTFHEGPVSAEQVNMVMASMAKSDLAGVLEYTDEPIVSADVRSSKASAVFDGLMTSAVTASEGDGRRSMVKTLTWYDNGWSYAWRVVELVEALGRTL